MNEEDIKILENYKEMNLDDFNYNERQMKQAIENLINRNKELEEIKDEAINTCFYTWNDDVELLCRKLAKYGYITIDKEKNEYISPFKDNPNLEESKDICEDISDYIPKSKVEETIEELKQEYKIELEKNSIKAFILKCKIEALEELLEH